MSLFHLHIFFVLAGLVTDLDDTAGSQVIAEKKVKEISRILNRSLKQGLLFQRQQVLIQQVRQVKAVAIASEKL
jgi:hypothetical protein